MNTQKKQEWVKNPLYHPRVAIEELRLRSENRAVRLFAILYPLWEVEVSCRQLESSRYELIEQYLERAIVECDLHTPEELSSFLGLSPDLILKVLQFLNAISHVTLIQGRWELTALGSRSIQEGTRYEEQEKHLRFYFESFRSTPLLKAYYQQGRVNVLTQAEAQAVQSQRMGGYTFHTLFSIRPWNAQAISDLQNRRDRALYNYPQEIYDLQISEVRMAYLPMYIIETRQEQGGTHYLVYTGIRELRDTYFEQLINHDRTIPTLLELEKQANQQDLWQEWLNERGISGYLTYERDNGIWQVDLGSQIFQDRGGKLSLSRVGDYELRNGYFLRLWCTDPIIRKRAAIERLLRLLKRDINRTLLHTMRQQVEQQLETAPISIDDLSQHAQSQGENSLLPLLDRLR